MKDRLVLDAEDARVIAEGTRDDAPSSIDEIPLDPDLTAKLKELDRTCLEKLK